MQEQGKRLIFAVVLALGVFLGYNMIFGKKTPPAGTGAGSGSAAVSTVSTLGPRAKPGDEIFKEPAQAGSAAPVAIVEQPDSAAAPKLHFPTFDVTFSNRGGGIAGWRLADERYSKVKDKDEAQLLPATIPGAAALQVNYRRVDDESALLPPRALWTGTKVSDTVVTYELDTPTVHVVKTFTVFPANYMVQLSVKTTFKTTLAGNPQVVPVITTYGFQDPKTDDAGNARVQPRVWQSVTMANGDLATTAGIKVGTSGAADASPRKADHVQWTGFMHPFLMAVIAPQKTSEDENITKHTEALEPEGLMRTDIMLTPEAAAAGSSYERSVVAYFGPKNYDLLDQADAVAKFPTGLRDTVDFGHLPLLGFSLSFIGKPLLWLLGQFYNVVGNWGVAIILLTLMVKIITLFWTTRSMRSMKAMASLSPQVQEIQKKYGDDKARAQQETMALYKVHGVSPLSGCAPMFLQIPIWSALYIMLSATGELYQAAFIPGWINDLTNSDPSHVLPFLLMATMFLQARLTPQAANQPGQKMMQYGMPLMFGVMSFYFPAGLSLYIFTNTVLSSLHSIYMNKFDKRSLAIAAQLVKNKEAVAAREAAAKAAEEAAKLGGGGKGKNGKKNGKKTTADGTIKALKAAATEESAATDAPATGEADSAADLPAGTGTEAAALVEDEQDDAADDALGASATTGSGAAARPRRKKRRR